MASSCTSASSATTTAASVVASVGSSDGEPGSSSVPKTPVDVSEVDAPADAAGTFVSIGAEGEVALPDLGLQGSWYPCTVLELCDDASALVKVPGLRDDSHESQNVHEHSPLARLRPVPPPPPDGFAERLANGMLAELWHEAGWWQVVVRQAPGGAAPSARSGRGAAAVAAIAAAAAIAAEGEGKEDDATRGADQAGNGVAAGDGAERRADDVAAVWVLETLQYGAKHRLVQPVLRPCWRWSVAEPERPPAWTIVERLPEPATPPPLPPPLPPPPPPPLPPRPPSVSTAEGKKPGKRKPTEPLGPGAKELKREEQQRELRELITSHYADGSLVEVRGSEEGFLGSWYGARVIEAKEARATVRLHLCYLAFQEDDGSLWEDTLDHHMVRPMPPERQDDFIDGLKKGAALEIFIEEGWWEVELVSRDGPNFLVESKRYKVQHVVQLAQLRPAWKWDDKARQWSVLDRLPQPKEKGSAPRAAPKKRSKN